jgi:uncharacterized membrane protein
MASEQKLPFAERVLPRAIISLVLAVVAATLAHALVTRSVWIFTVVLGWSVFSLVFAGWTWRVISGLNAEETRRHAVAEDPARGLMDTILLVASLGSIAGVAALLVGSASGGTSEVIPWEGLLGIASVAGSWILVHVMFVVRYADLYYSELLRAGIVDLSAANAEEVGGVSFNQKDFPSYRDFAYLSFTLGMTYQVSDTNISSSAIRHEAFRHGLVSYILGAVVLAVSVNLVVSLAQGAG